MKSKLGNRRLQRVLKIIEPTDLRRFLSENKKQLMLKARASLRLDNIPKDDQKLIEIASQIPASMYGILLDSLVLSAKEPSLTVSQAIDTLLAAEEIPNAADKSELDDCRWVVLRSLLSGQGDVAVSEYFNPVTSAPPGVEVEVPQQSGAVDGASSSDVLRLDPDRQGFTTPTSNTPTLAATPASISVVNNATQESTSPLTEIDPDIDEVIVRWKNNHPSFAEPVGVSRRGVWHPLNDPAKRKQLFPQSGDIFVSSTADHQGEYSSWKIRRNDDESKRTVFRGIQALGPVYRVYDLSARSDQPDDVRAELHHLGDSLALARAIFRLADGLMFKLRQGLNLATWDFSEAIDAWTSLSTVSHSSRDLVLSPLPKADTALDLADLAVIAKRVLQQAESFDQFPKFSRNAASELSKWISSSSDTATLRRRTEQLLARAHSIADQQILLDTFSDRLMELPSVRERIDQRISQAVEKGAAEKARLSAEIEALRVQRDVLRKQIDTEKRKVDDTSAKVMKAARKAFEKAVKEGEETLGQAALLSAVIGRGGPQASTAISPDSSSNFTSLEFEELSHGNSDDCEMALCAVGYSRVTSDAMSEAIRIASTSGLVIVFSGPGSALVCQATSESHCAKRGGLIRMKPGVIDDEFLIPFFEQQHEFDALCILNANTSPFELYGARLQAIAIQRNETGEQKYPSICISLTDSPAALPPSKMLRYFCIYVDLDSAQPDALTSITYDAWREGVLDELAKSTPPAPIATKIIKRIERNLNKDTSREALTLLRHWFVKGALLGSSPS